MIRESMNPILYDPLLTAALTSWVGTPAVGPLTGGKLKLFTNDIHPTRHSVLADFIEPTDTWYAPFTLVINNVPYLNDPNNLAIEATGTFTASALPAGGTMLFGYWVTNTAGTALLLAERFDSPVGFAENLQRLDLHVILPEPYSRAVPQS